MKHLLTMIFMAMLALCLSACVTEPDVNSADLQLENNIADETTPPAEKQVSAEDDEIICKTIKETGSRLSKKKVCATKAQWDQRSRQSRSTTDDLKRVGTRGS